MGTTIKDVAREANVAISTISKYLNGGNVRKKNQQAIERAIRKLNYAPNSVARGLRTAKTYRVGLVTEAGDNPHTSALLGEIEHQLWRAGYSLVYLDIECGNTQCMEEYIGFIVEMGVDGIVITSSRNSEDYLVMTREAGIPAVIMEECYTEVDTDCVQTDCTGGAYQAVEHLVKAGHRNIGVICGPEHQETAVERKRGYMRVMEDYGLPVRSEYVIEGDFKCGSGREGMKKLWQLPERPTAVFVTNYMMCLGAVESIYELGIQVPEELSVVAFDDFELSVVINPKLTAVRQPLKEMADEVCSLLVRRMNGDFRDFPQKVRLKPEYIERDSVAEKHW